MKKIDFLALDERVNAYLEDRELGFCTLSARDNTIFLEIYPERNIDFDWLADELSSKFEELNTLGPRTNYVVFSYVISTCDAIFNTDTDVLVYALNESEFIITKDIAHKCEIELDTILSFLKDNPNYGLFCEDETFKVRKVG